MNLCQSNGKTPSFQKFGGFRIADEALWNYTKNAAMNNFRHTILRVYKYIYIGRISRSRAAGSQAMFVCDFIDFARKMTIVLPCL